MQMQEAFRGGHVLSDNDDGATLGMLARSAELPRGSRSRSLTPCRVSPAATASSGDPAGVPGSGLSVLDSGGGVGNILDADTALVPDNAPGDGTLVHDAAPGDAPTSSWCSGW